MHKRHDLPCGGSHDDAMVLIKDLVVQEDDMNRFDCVALFSSACSDANFSSHVMSYIFCRLQYRSATLEWQTTRNDSTTSMQRSGWPERPLCIVPHLRILRISI